MREQNQEFIMWTGEEGVELFNKYEYIILLIIKPIYAQQIPLSDYSSIGLYVPELTVPSSDSYTLSFVYTVIH